MSNKKRQKVTEIDVKLSGWWSRTSSSSGWSLRGTFGLCG